MKNRLHDKKAGVALLSALFIISMLEVVFRLGCLRQSLLYTSNAGKPLATAIFAVILIIFTVKGKHRICYICYGAWLACFVMNQVFGLPSMIVDLVVNTTVIGMIAVVARIVCMVNIIAMGALLVEYMNDGTIYNRAFNILCIITILLFVADTIKCLYLIAFGSMPVGISVELEVAVFKKQMMLVAFNNAYYIAMIFLSTFFAYDSAKMQLKKINFSK